MSLLEFNPIAVYCNAILTAFNDLRLCLPLSLACDVASLVQSSLTAAVTCIVTFHRYNHCLSTCTISCIVTFHRYNHCLSTYTRILPDFSSGKSGSGPSWKSGHWPNPALAKFLAGFGTCQWSYSAFS